jgi:hypothetical protein
MKAMTRTLTGTFLVALLATAAAWDVAIPLGASNEILGVIALVIGSAVTLRHTDHMVVESKRRRENRP